MINWITLFLIVGILGLPILLSVLFIPMFASPPNASHSLYLGWLLVTVGYLILAAAFSAIVWFMLVRDAGDKIPPIVMLALGLMGLITYTLHLLGVISFSPISRLFISSETMFLSWLYITFGLVSLLTKQRTS